VEGILKRVSQSSAIKEDPHAARHRTTLDRVDGRLHHSHALRFADRCESIENQKRRIHRMFRRSKSNNKRNYESRRQRDLECHLQRQGLPLFARIVRCPNLQLRRRGQLNGNLVRTWIERILRQASANDSGAPPWRRGWIDDQDDLKAYSRRFQASSG
jgi:hypothetical protein